MMITASTIVLLLEVASRLILETMQKKKCTDFYFGTMYGIYHTQNSISY